MKMYYGSKTLFQKPTLGKGNPSNDYGLGFYLTPSEEMAILWASQFNEGGYLIRFSLEPEDLNTLTLSDEGEENILRWIAILVKHRFSYQERSVNTEAIDWLTRHFGVPTNKYDLVVGYRADDSYFNYSLGFVRGDISIETLSLAMKLGKLGLQYVLMTEKGLNHLSYEGYERVSHTNDYSSFREKTMEEYHALLQKEDLYNHTFIRDLMKKYGR